MTKLPPKLLLSLIVYTLLTNSLHGITNALPRNFFDGIISGKVTKADGLTPIPGATVKAIQGTTTIGTTTADAAGDYVLPQLAAGTYRVEASATGFATKSQSLVTLVDSQTATVNLKLDEIVTGSISYIYDASGRLAATVGPVETTIYSYDSVGNLLSISRQPSSQLSIISVVPGSGSVGQLVTINGTGFGTTPSVQFNGVAATLISAADTRIVTSVPAVGVTGQIQIAVITPQGTANAPFTVLPAQSGPSIQIAPPYHAILPGQTLQFFATVSGITGDQSLQWSVNGIPSGDGYVGTISSTGFYTAPNQSSHVFTIRATSVANPAVFGQAQLAILDPSLVEAPISASLTVLRLPPINFTPATSVSVLRRATDSVAPVSQVSVRRLSPTDTGAPIAARISVRRNDAATSGAPIAATISVRRNEAVSGAPQSASVSLTTGPLVQLLTPTSASKSTSFTITINGANFGGTTGIFFLKTDGTVDSNISASNITVDPNGTSLTATITVSGTAALGQRVVVVTTAAGNSLTVSTGTNMLEIVQ
ncbi:MAG TPA: carboxypeptidase regulatory-like domain-containing protein [Pyrinomonadaceae bacterium]|nr:carboxypeptidase regulatory-like domain-containing protein [Pyrinomonadaceae bacterium]